MKRLLLALLLALCAGRAPAETREDLYWRLHRERNAVTRYGAPPTGTNGVTLLEYVESTRTQWIDTGYTGRSGWLECDMTHLGGEPDNYPKLFGKVEYSVSPYWPYRAICYYGKGNGKLNFENGYSSRTLASRVPSDIVLPKTQWRVQIPASESTWNDRPFQIFNYSSAQGCNARLRMFRLWDSSGVLIRDFRPVKDAAGVAGLLDMVSGEIFYSATSTPLVAGPELRPATVLPTVSRETVREMLAPAPTGEPPELAGGDLWLDCLAIPEGNWLCECPIAGSTNTAWRGALCSSNILRAVVWRHAVGLAPTNLPVTLEHDPSRVIGRIERLYYEAGTGVVARISITQAGYAWAVSNHCAKPSPDVRAMYTNLVVRTDGWRYEHQDYLDEVVVPTLRDYGTRPEHAAELATFAALTNVPAATPCLVMAPVYLRGLSLVSLPLLPTYIEYRVPDHLRDVYPIRPPRQWTWR